MFRATPVTKRGENEFWEAGRFPYDIRKFPAEISGLPPKVRLIAVGNFAIFSSLWLVFFKFRAAPVNQNRGSEIGSVW